MVDSLTLKPASDISSAHGSKVFYKQVLYRMAERGEIVAYKHSQTGELLFDEGQVIKVYCEIIRQRVKDRYNVVFQMSYSWRDKAEFSLERPVGVNLCWDSNSLSETDFYRQKLEPFLFENKLWYPQKKVCPKCGSDTRYYYQKIPDGHVLGIWQCIKPGCNGQIFRHFEDLKLSRVNRHICKNCYRKTRGISYIVDLKGVARSVGVEWLTCIMCKKRFNSYTADEPLIFVK